MDKEVLKQKMLSSMEQNFKNGWEDALARDTAARERYQKKVSDGATCVYAECLLTSPLLEELHRKARELKSMIPEDSLLIQVGRSPWLLQEMMQALKLNVTWKTMPFSHRIGFARTEWELVGCSGSSPWATEDLPEPQKSWVTSYLNFLRGTLEFTEERLAVFEGRIFIIDYVSSGESLQDALELVNKAIGGNLGIRKVGFSEGVPPPSWSTNPKNIYFRISKKLGLNMMLKHGLSEEEAKKHGLAERDPDSFFENAHGHTFYPAEWNDPIALARVAEPASLTLTAAAKRQQIVEYVAVSSIPVPAAGASMD